MSAPARAAIERAARDSYGRLLGRLAARSRDVAACEDALSDAFRSALERWPEHGVPTSPEGWLLRAAQNRLRDRARHEAVIDRASEVVAMLIEERERAGDPEVADPRLALMLVCAHPAIDAQVRAPLMLQVVLGLGAADVARAFMVTPEAMAKRLVRAKSKIARAAIPFEAPERALWGERISAVLDAVYAAYARSWDLAVVIDDEVAELRLEALHLAEILHAALPDEPDAAALLALMLYCESRSEARRDASGAYVPLDAQDVRRWDDRMIERAETLLRTAARAGTASRLQLEAAIQSCHVARLRDGSAQWAQVVALYVALNRVAPSVGAWLGACAAVAEAEGAPAAWTMLERASTDPRALEHGPYWALRAELASRLGDTEGARAAYARALEHAVDPAVRAWLEQRSAREMR